MEIKRIFGGTLVSYLNIIVSSVTNLLLVPIYIYYLGDENYGLWLIVLTLISYLGFSHLGIGQSISNFVARSNANQDYASIETGVSTAFWLYFAIVTPLIILITIVINAGFMASLIDSSSNLASVVEPVVLVSSILFLFKLPLTVFGASLRALNLIYLEQLLSLIFTIIQFLCILLTLYLGYGLISLSLVYGTTGIILGVATLICLKKNTPNLTISIRHFSPDLASALIKPGGYFFLLQIAGALIAGLDNIVIGKFLGVKEVVPFAVAMKLCFLCMSVMSVITSNLLPSITHAFSQSDSHELRRIYFVLLKLCFGMGSLIFLNMMAVGPDFIIFWVGNDSYIGELGFYLILTHLMINTVLWPADAIIVGTSRHRLYALTTVFEGLLNLSLSIYLVQFWGVAGVILATILARGGVSFWYMLWQAGSITEIGLYSVVKATITTFWAPILASLMVILLLNQLGFEGIFKILVYAIIITTTYLLVTFFVALDSVTQSKVITVVTSRAKKFSRS